MKSIRVLVTGAGSGVGQGIIKALRLSDLQPTIVSCDIAPLKPPLYRTEEAVLIPRVESEGALSQILDILQKRKIDLVMVGSEYDLDFFSRHKDEIEAETGAIVIASPPETVSIAADKWETSEFLRRNNLPYAESHVPVSTEDAVETARSWGYPLILKPRRGTASHNVHLISDEKQLLFFFKTIPNAMLQKMICRPDGSSLGTEYTCSIFKCEDGIILGPFTSRRTLRGGTSWVIEVDRFEKLHPILREIGNELRIIGSFNVQLMVNKDGPVPFEFNARFSGTTAIRAHFGFNEADFAIRNFFLHETVSDPIIRKGYVMRYIEEVFLDEKLPADPLHSFPQGVIRNWF